MFVTLKCLRGGPDFEEQLRKKQIEDDTLKQLFEKPIESRYKKQQPSSSSRSRSNANCKALLLSDPRYWNIQTWLLQKKTGRFAHCSSRICQQKLNVGSECFRVVGALAVTKQQEVVDTRYYFCADNPRCIIGDFAPGYSNVKQPVDFETVETEQRMRLLGVK